MRALSLIVLLAGCYAPPIERPLGDVEPGSTVETPAPVAPAPPVCDMAKFSFTQEVGCVNDGWVEFCAEKAGAPVAISLRAIAPDVSIAEGIIGRAGCNEVMEYFVTLPLKANDCTARHGALKDESWKTLCALSQLRETKHFVPGFAE